MNLYNLYKHLLIRGSFGINAGLTADVLVMKIVQLAIMNVVLVLVVHVIVMQCAEVGGLTETQSIIAVAAIPFLCKCFQIETTTLCES